MSKQLNKYLHSDNLVAIWRKKKRHILKENICISTHPTHTPGMSFREVFRVYYSGVPFSKHPIHPSTHAHM